MVATGQNIWPWREGNFGGSVVGDSPVGCGDAETIEVYGGLVIAESVPERFRPLIIAAPDMLIELELLLHRKAECDENLSRYMEARIRAVVAKARGKPL